MNYFDRLEGSDKDIKIFTRPVYNSLLDRINYLYGTDSDYAIGDKVCYKTFWYDYSKNFTMIDDLDIFVITDGIYTDHYIYGVEDIDDYKDAFTNDRKIIDGSGDELSIYDKYSLMDYMNKQKDFVDYCNKITIMQENLSKYVLDEAKYYAERLAFDALNNSYQLFAVNKYKTNQYKNKHDLRMRDIGAYLWLAKYSVDSLFLYQAKKYLGNTPLEYYLAWNHTSTTEKPEVYRAYERIMNYEDNT